MTILRMDKADDNSPTIYDEAVYVYHEIHWQDPEQVSYTREKLNKLRGRSYDKVLLEKGSPHPPNYLDHLSACCRCYQYLTTHRQTCSSANRLFLHLFPNS